MVHTASIKSASSASEFSKAEPFTVITAKCTYVLTQKQLLFTQPIAAPSKLEMSFPSGRPNNNSACFVTRRHVAL